MGSVIRPAKLDRHARSVADLLAIVARLEAKLKAKREGRYKGRVPTARRLAIWLRSEGIRPAEIARRLAIGGASVYRVLSEREKVAA